MRLTLRHAAAVVFVLAACYGDDTNSTAPNSDSGLKLSLSAAVDTIPESTSKLLTASVTDQNGLPKSATIAWSSTDPNIVTVSNGLVTAVARGVASVVASTDGAADTARIVVTENNLILDVQPSAASVAVGDIIDFTATVRTRSGGIVAVNSFNWSLSDTSAAEFVGEGSLLLKKEGNLSIIAKAMDRSGNSDVKVFRSPVASVTITPGTASIYRGETLTLKATLRDDQGREVRDGIRWGSTDFSKATVTQDGFVTGVATGSVVITATSDGRTGSATINVKSPAAVNVNLSVPVTTLLIGQTIQAVATATDATGQPVTGKTIGWQTNNPAIATVTSSGEVKGIAEGSVTLSASIDAVVASTQLTVKGRKATSMSITPSSPSVSVGQQSQLVARVFDQNQVEMPGQVITWTSSSSAVAAISSSGMLQGYSSGITTIKATSGLLSATVVASVVGTSVASVRISPASVNILYGTTTTLVAEALDANGQVLAGRSATWSSQNPSVASVSSTGLVNTLDDGTSVITANIEGKTASVLVTVTPPGAVAVASITVTSPSVTLDPGQQAQATATLKDANGNVLTGRTITWSSLDTSVVKVNANGLVTAVKGGTVAVMARSGTASGSISMTVTTTLAAPVAKTWVEAPKQSLLVGESVQTVVTLFDASGNVLTGRTITYVAENPAVLSVSAMGLVKGMAPGSTRIKVTSGGVTGTETFTVTSPVSTLSSISVTPATTTLSVGGSTQATAVAKDANGATVSGTTFTWTTSNAGVATVSGSGLISAVGAGSATITAAASGKTGSMSVTVNAPTAAVVKTVSVAMSASSITVGATSQATFQARDINGAIISGKSATWSVGGSSLAQVASSGLVTGLAAGTVTVSATVDGIAGSASLTINPSAPLPPPPTSATVELPRVYLNYSYPAKTGQTIVVAAGGNLQTALNNAQRGDEIVLAAGATFTGNFTLPAKAGTAADGWIVVRSDKLNQLPAQGTRVSASQASLMPRILTDNTQPAFQTTGAASGWWLAGLEVSVSPSFTAHQYGIITLGGNQSTLAAAPQDLVLDRMYIHGQTTTNLSRCVALNSGRTQITDSYISECHGKDFDSQAIAGWNGPGPFKIVNNMLMGAGENIMFGGADPAAPGLVPSDIEIRRNHIYTPVAWKGVWMKKNLLETKNAVRVLIEENVFDGSWTHAQTGWAMILKSENQSGGCRWCRTTDVTIRRNYFTNAGAGISIAPRTNGADSTTSRILISENVLENIGVGAFDGDKRGFQLLVTTSGVAIERNVLSGSLAAALILDGGAPCVFKDNVWASGSYGVFKDGGAIGKAALDAGCGVGKWQWSNQTMIGNSGGNVYPAGTTWVSSESAAPLAGQIRGTVSASTSKAVSGTP